ncbi:MAG: hypothetical protein RLO52_22575 [Sandaracinaceae bacterium]
MLTARVSPLVCLLVMAGCAPGETDDHADAATSRDARADREDDGGETATDGGLTPDGGAADARVADLDASPGELELPPPTLFSDGFESGDLSATNPEGFRWGGPNRTSVVTQHPSDGPVVLHPTYIVAGDTTSDGTPRHWTASEGDNSLRFRFPAGEPWSEQRFDLGTPEPELWLRFWLRVPLNYVHGPIPSPGRNQKLLALWMDGYEGDGDGSTVWLGFHPSGDGSDSTVAFSYSRGGYSGSLGYEQDQPFVASGSDRGRWMQMVLHVRAETSPGASDGVIETWRRWRDEPRFTKLHESFDAAIVIPPGGPAGFRRGYLLGWANGHYAVDTEWLLDQFELSREPLVPGY